MCSAEAAPPWHAQPLVLPLNTVWRNFSQLASHALAYALQPFPYLLAYLVVLYIRPQEYLPAFIGTPLVPVLLMTTLVLWLIGQSKDFQAPQHGLMLWLTLCMFLSIVFTGWLSGAIKGVTDFIPTLLLFYVIATSVVNLKRFQAICLLLSAVSAVIAWHGIEQADHEYGIGWTGARTIEGRITYLGFLNDPNDLSMAFLMTLPMTFYLARVYSWLPLRLGLMAMAGVTLYGIFLCNSRGSMLGILAMLTYYSIGRYGLLRSVVVGPLLVAPLLLLAPSRISEISADEESAAGRVDAWFAAFEMFKSRPLFGVGKNLFTDHNPLTAHNSYVLAMAELGLIGYFVWLSILVLSVIMLMRVLKAPLTPPSMPVQMPPAETMAPDFGPVREAVKVLAYAFIGSMVAAFFLSRSYVVFVYVLVALIIALFQLARRCRPDIAPLRVGELLGRLVLIEVISIVFLWITTRVLLITS